MKPIFRTVLFVSSITAVSGFCASAFASPFDQILNGQVIEREGGQPVADAWVFATWLTQGADPFGSRTSCARVEVTRTDKAGRLSFRLPPFGSEPGVRVFKPKYNQYFAKNTLTAAESYAANRRVEMVPFTGSGDDRRGLYTTIRSLLSCRSGNVIETLRPLYEAVDQEASELGVRPTFVKSLEGVQRDIDLERQRQERRMASATASSPTAVATLFDRAMNGQVVERDGGRPVADAWVFATWSHQGADPLGSRTGCLRFEIARTDAVGRFSITLPALGDEPEVQVFKPKVRQFIDRAATSDAQIRASNRRVEVVPFAGTGEDRRHLYNAIHHLLSCRGDDIERLRPLYEAADQEASELGARATFVMSLDGVKRDRELEKHRQQR